MHELTSLDVDLRGASYTRNSIILSLVFHAFNIDHQPSWIKSLRLHGIDFGGYYGVTYPTFPEARELQTLKHLQLLKCAKYEPFLQMLIPLSLDLATLTIDDLQHSSGTFGDDANDSIRSLSSLERVSLTLDTHFDQPHGLLDWSTLDQCASVIKSLKLQYHSALLPYQSPYPSEESVSEFRHFCKNALSLEQLSMSGIDLPINKTSGDPHIHGSLEQFLVSLHFDLPLKGIITDTHLQDCVQTASALVVLKLTIWLSCDTIPLSVVMHDLAQPLEADVKVARDLAQRREHLVKRTADKILSTFASSCPRLKVVVIETAWEYGRDDYAVRAFLRSKQTDLYGRTTIVGMSVEPHMVKHYEPCSDILYPDEFVLA